MVLVDIYHHWQMFILSMSIILLPEIHQKVITTGRCSQIMRDDKWGVQQESNYKGTIMVYFGLACWLGAELDRQAGGHNRGRRQQPPPTSSPEANPQSTNTRHHPTRPKCASKTHLRIHMHVKCRATSLAKNTCLFWTEHRDQLEKLNSNVRRPKKGQCK